MFKLKFIKQKLYNNHSNYYCIILKERCSKIAEEFASFLDQTRKAPMEEKLNAFGDIVEKIMQIILKIPDLVDISLQDVNSKVSNIQNQLNALNGDITALKSRPVAAASPVSAAPRAPGGAPGGPPPPPPGGSRPGSPPPPPPGGSRPGSPPPPGGPGGPGGPKPARPAQPVSLRGAIMGELKSLFAKRRTN